MKTFRNDAGFTLAELLIAVAIILVLVAIAVPLFGNVLEKSREATDLSNARATYAEVKGAFLSQDESPTNGVTLTDGTYAKTIALEQQLDDWQTELPLTLGGITWKGEADHAHWKGTPGAGGTCTVSYDEATGAVFTWSGGVAADHDGIGTSAIASYAASIKTVFEALVADNKASNFLVLNSTYTKNNGTITGMETGIADLDETIGTWSIIMDGSTKTTDTSKANYLVSTVDVSDTTTWKAGDSVPALMQKSDGSYVVGMAKVYRQTDATPAYNVISRDASGKYAHDNGFDLDTVIRNDDAKKTFTSASAAYAYYGTLEASHS